MNKSEGNFYNGKTGQAKEDIASAMREAAEPYIGKQNLVTQIGQILDKDDNAETRAGSNMLSVLTSFSGADTVIVINGEVYGEIEALHFNSRGGELCLDVSLFQTIVDIAPKLTSLKDVKIYQVFANEYNYALIREFNNVTFIGEESSISVDDITPYLRYVYSCESFINFRLPVDQDEVSKIVGTYKAPDPKVIIREHEIKKSWEDFHNKWRNVKNCMFYDGDLGALLRNPVIAELLVEGKISVQSGVLCVSSKWRGPKPIFTMGSEPEEKLLEVQPNCYIGRYDNGWVRIEYNYDSILRDIKE